MRKTRRRQHILLLGFICCVGLIFFVFTSKLPGVQKCLSRSRNTLEQFEIHSDPNRFHAKLLRRGREFVLGKHEVELTLKYWELHAWFKSLNNRTRIEEMQIPEPYGFGNASLWEHGYEDASDKILAQLVWRLQLVIGNFVRTYGNGGGGVQYKKYKEHTIGARVKRIFMGDMIVWPPWTIRGDWAKSNQISGCYKDFLPQNLAEDLEPSCHIVQTQPVNWTNIDLIVQILYYNPFKRFRWIKPPPKDEPVPWFRYTLESPFTHPQMATRRSQFFNSYWGGSLVQHKYMKWIYYDPNVRELEQGKDYSYGKSKMAAMLVSNCNHTYNARLAYAYELGKNIEVDIYGECGQECPDEHGRGCFEILRDYRFYLAFENSNCQDYVTEKLHSNAFLSNAIPIVMGAPPSFYLQHAPQNSYIHAQDFASPKALAVYLRVLASNSTMYNDYFRWRGTGEVLEAQSPWLCTVCAMLYYDKPLKSMLASATLSNSIQWVPQYADNGQPHCLQRNEWYW